jgi:ABC-type multidrug transport system permease subunit
MIKTRLFQTIVLSIYAGGLYCKFGPSYTNTINFHALTGYCFFLSFNAVFTALTPVALTFPLERTVFLKEESAKLYGPTEYFMSKNTVELPYAVFFPALQSLIMYWFVGLSSTPEQFFIFFFIIFLSNLCGMSIGLLAGSLTADPKNANGISMLILIPFLIFSGLFKNQANLPAWIGWIQYISPFKYNFSALMQNETLYKNSNIRLLNLDVGLWGSIAILAGLGVAARLLSLFFLWKHKAKLE